MNDTCGAFRHDDETLPEAVVLIVLDNADDFDPLRLLSHIIGDEPPAGNTNEVPTSLFPLDLFIECILPPALEVTPEDKRAVLHHCLEATCRLEPFLAEPRFPHTPGRSSVKRQRLIKRQFRHDAEALQEALLSALAYELIDRLSVDDGNSCRDCLLALDECCALIAFMRRHNITRSSFTDEVMNAPWLRQSERFRALRNRPWFNKRKARFQDVMRRVAG